MTEVWIIGRKATIASNGHDYIAEPFIAFASEADAIEARDIILKITGETIWIVKVPIFGKTQGATP